MKKSVPKRHKVALSRRTLRSAISNGTCLLSTEIDQRGPLMRRLRDLVSDHTSDLGGSDAITTAERALVNRASMLTLLAEVSETTFIQNKAKVHPRELVSYFACVGNLVRVLSTLGLQRRAKRIPSLQEYLRSKQGDIDDAEGVEDAEAGQ